jgi:tetratricopeptide (TPR) repeat protein
MAHPAETEPLHAAARAALAASDLPSLARVARELITLSESLGDRRELGYGYYYLGAAYFWRNDARQAEGAYRKGLDLLADLNDRDGTARITLGLAATAMQPGLDTAKARRLYEEALSIVREIGDKKLLAATLGSIGELCQFEADYVSAMRCTNESMTLFQELRMPGSAGVQCVNRAHIHTLRRDYAAALECLQQAFDYIGREPNPRRIAWYIDMCFVFAAALAQWEIAARLLGFVNRYRDEENVSRLELTPWFTGHIERVSNHLGEDRLQELQLEGEALILDEVPAIVDGILERAQRETT